MAGWRRRPQRLGGRRAAIALAASAVPLLGGAFANADSTWNVGSGNWSQGSNWTAGVPTSGAARIVSSDSTTRTITFDYDYASPIGSVIVDNTGSGTNILSLSNSVGRLSTSSDQNIGLGGSGYVYHSAGSNTVGGSLMIGAGSVSSGTNGVGLYAMSNTASLVVQGDEYIGSLRIDGGPFGKSGTFNQTNGSHSIAGNLNIAYAAGSTGSFTLSNGTLTVGGEVNIGWAGSGVFNQNGGVVNVGSVVMYPDASAAYNISSGSLQAGYISLNSATANPSFTMTGGSVSTAGGMLGIGNSCTFTMSNNSSLTVGQMTVDGTFTQNSGTSVAAALGGSGTVQLVSGTFNVGTAGASIGNFTLATATFAVAGDVQLTDGSSKFTQNGGNHNITGSLLINADVANPARTDPHYLLAGGTVQAGVRIAVGDLAQKVGELSQTGGKLSTPILDIGRAGSGTVTLSGGTLSAGITNIYAGGNLVLAGGNFTGTNIGTLAGRLSIQAPASVNLTTAITLTPSAQIDVNANLDLVSPALISNGATISGTARISFGAASGLSGFGIVSPSITTSAPITAKSGNLTLLGPSLIINSGASLSNNVGANLFISANSVTNSGNIAVNAGGAVVFDNAPLSVASGKTITLAGGALAAPTLVNSGTISGSGQFTGSLTNGAGITLNGPSQFFGPVLNQSTGNITVRNSQLLITGMTTNNGTIRAQTGGSVVFDGGLVGNPLGAPLAGAAVVDASSSLTTPYIRQASLSMSGVAGSPATYSKATIRPSSEGGDTSVLASLAIQTDGGGVPLGTIDLANNGMIIDYASSSPIETLRQYITSAYAPASTNHWTGTGITSSTAAAASDSRAIGYGEASQLLGLAGTATKPFMGQTADATSVLLRTTVLGDSNLDGTVNFIDLVAVAQNYNAAGTGRWSTGDFNYDGNVNFIDLVAVAQHYNEALAGPIPGASADFNADLAQAFATVPEPACLGLLATALIGMARRRRRG